MMIEDEELRDIYKTASEEHLQKLEDGLLHLEKHPHDTVFLEDVLREAHTLKGDSRMLGVTDVETLIHQLEETLAAVKKGEFLLSSQICDRLYQGLDAIRKLVHEAVTGEPAGVNVFYVLAQLMGSDETTPSAQNLEISSHTDRHTEESLFPDAIVEESELFNADSLFSNTTTESPELFTVNSLFANTAIESAEVFSVDSLFPDTITETPKVTPSPHPTPLRSQFPRAEEPPHGTGSSTEETSAREWLPIPPSPHHPITPSPHPRTPPISPSPHHLPQKWVHQLKRVTTTLILFVLNRRSLIP